MWVRSLLARPCKKGGCDVLRLFILYNLGYVGLYSPNLHQAITNVVHMLQIKKDNMNISQLRAKVAGPDIVDIDLFNIQIQFIKKKIEEFPKGIDIPLPLSLLPVIEDYCDKRNIPFLHITENYASVASTYRALWKREQDR